MVTWRKVIGVSVFESARRKNVQVPVVGTREEEGYGVVAERREMQAPVVAIARSRGRFLS